MPKQGLMVAIGLPRNGGGHDIGSPDGLDTPPKRGGAPAEQESPEEDSAEQKASPDEVGFHDGTEVCTNCVHYDDQNNECERWGFSVGDNPQGAYCHAWKGGQGHGMGGGGEMSQEEESPETYGR